MMNEKFREDRTPLFLKVAEVLRQRIMREVWKTGEFLPTVNKLMEEFQVARVTVREAIKILASEGLVDPKRGRGTTILPHKGTVRPLSVVTKLSELVDLYRGDVPDLVSLDDMLADLPDGVTSGISAGQYHMIRRIHSRDGQRYCIITLYLAKAIFDKHEAQLRTHLALPILFDDPKIDISIARQRLLISKCDLESAMHLNLSVGEPVAEVRRVLCDANSTILYLADVIYRGDYIQLDMDLLA
ncbi:MAG: GntR family transcriptional regulator [Proteobacteria bacterium]|jgi:GntR family transcriptional regulator|nr:GntR family transcriptional regulator [Pseudomonadota bacterium]